jgi:RNA polymerase sigma-70 factor (ECF subfamily)
MLDKTQQNVMLEMRRKLFGYACALSRDISSAEDLYQETMLRAMSAAHAPDDEVACRVWMFKIMRNLWIDTLRAEGRLPVFDDTTEIDDVSVTTGEDLVVNALAVRQAFGNLSKAHRDILALVDICGFSYADAAKMLDVPTGTIMSRISRARAALAKQMQDEVQIISLPLRRVKRKLGQTR